MRGVVVGNMFVFHRVLGWKTRKFSSLALISRRNRGTCLLIAVMATVGLLLVLLVPSDERLNLSLGTIMGRVTEAAASTIRRPDKVIVLPSIEKLGDMFASVGYHLEGVRNGSTRVPRLTLAALPPDIVKVSSPNKRKAIFLRYMLPLVLEANQRVYGQRLRLIALERDMELGVDVSSSSRQWLLALAEEYQVEAGDVLELIRRVDATPPSLALAQAAIESGWGTSRFALEGNSAFGQWTTEQYDGIVPNERPNGHTYKIRLFERPIDAVHSYLRNLNTHRAYRSFRERREELRAGGGTLDSLQLLDTLEGYSQDGESYVKLMRSVITINSLKALDNAQLGEDVLIFGSDI